MESLTPFGKLMFRVFGEEEAKVLPLTVDDFVYRAFTDANFRTTIPPRLHEKIASLSETRGWTERQQPILDYFKDVLEIDVTGIPSSSKEYDHLWATSDSFRNLMMSKLIDKFFASKSILSVPWTLEGVGFLRFLKESLGLEDTKYIPASAADFFHLCLTDESFRRYMVEKLPKIPRRATNVFSRFMTSLLQNEVNNGDQSQ